MILSHISNVDGTALALTVQHCSLHPKEVAHRALNLEVGVNGAVEATCAAPSATIAGVVRLATSRSADEEDNGRDDATPTVPSVNQQSAALTRVLSRASLASLCGGTALIPQSLVPGHHQAGPRSGIPHSATPPLLPPQQPPLLPGASASQAGMTSQYYLLSYLHAHMPKINSSYIKICESSCLVLPQFLPASQLKNSIFTCTAIHCK